MRKIPDLRPDLVEYFPALDLIQSTHQEIGVIQEPDDTTADIVRAPTRKATFAVCVDPFFEPCLSAGPRMRITDSGEVFEPLEPLALCLETCARGRFGPDFVLRVLHRVRRKHDLAVGKQLPAAQMACDQGFGIQHKL